MHLKSFGIFLAFGPTVDLRVEGLGRLLGAFLKSAAAREDVRFVIACPQWSRANLLAFCESEGIPATAFDIVSTGDSPFLLRLYLAYLSRKGRPPKKNRFAQWLASIRRGVRRHRKNIERRIADSRYPVVWFGVAFYVAILSLVLIPLAALIWFSRALASVLLRTYRQVAPRIVSVIGKLLAASDEPGEERLDFRMFRLMEEAETQRMRKMIDDLAHVGAWLSPTAFWPEFNNIAAPHLLCVPDVVPIELPVGFGEFPVQMFKAVATVERSIRSGRHFVTYSARTKWSTLVDRYSVRPENVAVVPHACWDLKPWIAVRGYPDADRASENYCVSLLNAALARCGADNADDYVRGLDGGSLRFLFYPSQFRPNKNVVMLLQAYEHLLRERFIQLKLILTGDPNGYHPVRDFIRDHELDRDVLFLNGLSSAELAACYHLADLAVNPSLSEGGCPFTLTEALSVNTPVVMARIPVTEEVIVDPALRAQMLFDPYDYRNAASRIEWALHNREGLLSVQQEFYARLGRRTWRTVVDEYVSILDRLAEHAPIVEEHAG